MNPLPQLRTVRDGPTPSPHPPPPSASSASSTPPPPKPIEHPRLPAPAQQLLGEAIQAGLLTSADVAGFLAKVGDRIAQLNTRDRAGDALAHFGLLTSYQKARLISGQTHGMILGNYRVLDRIGGGTVGTVFTAIHPFLRRRVAVKVLTFEGEARNDTAERFLDEARILALLEHPNVLRVLDAGMAGAEGRDESLLYSVLELVEGGDVENFVYDHGAQPLPQACEWGRQIALGLRAIHDAGIVHRDIKPGNLLLTSARTIKIGDFGLARQPTSTRTPCQALLGTVEFLAPEQLQDPTTVGPAADIYSLGVTLFWILTGKLPYPEGLGLRELTDFILKSTPRRLKEVRSGLPPELGDWIAQMLNANPAHRPSPALVAQWLGSLIPAEVLPATDQLEKALALKDEQIVEAHAAVLASLAGSVIACPGESLGHQRRMSSYVHRMARALGKSTRWVAFADPKIQEELAAVAAIHDLGLRDVPDAIVDVEAHLRTPSEAHAIQQHPLLGDAILDRLAEASGGGFPFLRVLRAVVRHHHENWDGTGYPDKLSGENIPMAARIVALADAYDGLRNTLGHSEAMQKLDAMSGQRFDPSLVQQLRSCQHDWDSIFCTIPDSGQSEVVPLLAAAKA